MTLGHKSRLLERGDRRSRHAVVGLGLLMWLLQVLVRVCLEESFVCTKGAKSRLLRRNLWLQVGRLLHDHYVVTPPVGGYAGVDLGHVGMVLESAIRSLVVIPWVS